MNLIDTSPRQRHGVPYTASWPWVKVVPKVTSHDFIYICYQSMEPHRELTEADRANLYSHLTTAEQKGFWHESN